MNSEENNIADTDFMRSCSLVLFSQHVTLRNGQPIMNEFANPLEIGNSSSDIIVKVVERPRLCQQEFIRQPLVGPEQDEVGRLIAGGVDRGI